MARTGTILVQASLLPALTLAGCGLASHGYAAFGGPGPARDSSGAPSCVEYSVEDQIELLPGETIVEGPVVLESGDFPEGFSGDYRACETCDPVVAIPIGTSVEVEIEHAPPEFTAPRIASRTTAVDDLDPPSVPSIEELPPLPAPRPRSATTVARAEASRANYDGPTVASRLRLAHRLLPPIGGRVAGAVHGLAARIGAHERHPPEAEPFVVYERVAPRFLPVPTRPVFEPATATPASVAFPTPLPLASEPTRSPAARPSKSPLGEETLPRPLPEDEASPLPPPDELPADEGLPPAPRIEELE